jgi:Flp pilus assembly pilin Flp
MTLWREETGQDLVEYVLLVSLIALAVALAFPPLATAMAAAFNSVATALGGGAAPGP